MQLSQFESSIQECKEFLLKIKILKAKGIKNINKDDVSQEFKTASQKASYLDIYQCAIRNFDYDFLLHDDSFFQFSFRGNSSEFPSMRFAYFQNPYDYKSYKDFILELRDLGYINNETDEEIGEIFWEDYQQYLSEQDINSSSVSIRYDVDLKNYSPLIHSVSHFHIGHRNDVRIPCDRVVTPLKFVIFVIKHAYYHVWKQLVESGSEPLLNSLKNAKNKCTPLTIDFWADNEKSELFIS